MNREADNEILLRRQSRKGMIRETLLEDAHTFVKRFVIPSGSRSSTSKPWLREHEALKRLDGAVAGRSLGFGKKMTKEGLEIVLRKEYVPGRPLDTLPDYMVPAFAQLLARLHQQRVVMYDPNLENFVLDESGEIHCIDFGRSAIYATRGPLFLYGIGSEFAKCIHETFADDDARWSRFIEAYFDAYPHGAFARWFIMQSLDFALKARASRDARRRPA